MEISLLRLEFYLTEHLADVRREGNSVLSELQQDVREKRIEIGTGSRVSLSDDPDDVRAEASKTGRTLVVVDELLNTPWTGR